MSNILRLRKTHTYVGTYQDLDEWEDIGTFEVVARGDVYHDEEDICDGTRQTLFVKVSLESPDSPQDPKNILLALEASFTMSGCAHEWDCCGCRSYFATATPIKGDLYEITQTTSRNY